MEHVVDTLECGSAGFEIADITLDELETVLDSFQIAELSGGEIIQHTDPSTALHECVDDIGSNEPRAAGDQIHD
jgi:hypothetical protein